MSYTKQGNCVELLKEIEENSVDCVITDPPYNVSRENNFQSMGPKISRMGMDFGEWDKDFNITEFIYELPRILKDNANVVIFNSWQNLTSIEQACNENHIEVKRCLVLNKTNPAPFNRDRMFVNDVEFALWGVYNSKDKQSNWTFNRMNPVEKCVIDTQVQSSDIHPTMKDIKVMKYLIEVLLNKGDTILDPFMGSGSTGKACMIENKERNANYKFIGVEMTEEYLPICETRINFGMNYVSDFTPTKPEVINEVKKVKENLW